MSEGRPAVTVEAVNEALDNVIDPCSVAVGVPMSLRQMGLVRHLEITAEGVVEIHLRMTSPGCHMGPVVFEPAIREQVGAIPGVTEVRIDFLEALGWSEDDIDPVLRQRLVERRRARAAAPRPSESRAAAPR